MKIDHGYRASKIEQALRAHGIVSQVWEVEVTPSFWRYKLTTAISVSVRRVEQLDDDIAYNLGVPSVRIFRRGGMIFIEVPKGESRRVVRFSDFSNVNLSPGQVVLGIENDAPLLLRLDSPDTNNVLIAGSTGSGKSCLINTILASIINSTRPSRFQIIAIDPKGYKFDWLKGIPHVREIATADEDALDALSEMIEVMRARRKLLWPRYIVVIDELGEFVHRAREAVDMIVRLTSGGREAGIHVVAGIQRPAARLIGNMAKANFPCRICGAVTSAEDAKVALGIAGTGAEKLQGRGDFILVYRGRVLRFQAAYLEDAECAAIGDKTGRPRKQVCRSREEIRFDKLPLSDEDWILNELRRRYEVFGSINKVIASAGWGKGPRSFAIVKRAIDDSAEDKETEQP